MSTIYILINKENKSIWGIYNSEIFLQDKINTLRQNLPDIQLEVEEKIINTNITKQNIINPEFKNNKLIVNTSENENENKIVCKNEEIQSEIMRIEEFYKNFKEDLKSYNKIVENELEVPEFFKNKFEVIKKINNNNIAEKEKFSYFISNIYYK